MPMRVHDYLQKFPSATDITLVGPLFDGAHAPPEPVIFVDAGVRHQKGGAGVSVGDGDSAGRALDEALPVQKAVSDLGYALRQIPPGFCRAALLGFLGGRRDHEFCNFGEAHQFLIARAQPARIRFDANAALGFSQGAWRINARGVFTVVCLQTARVQLGGACRYPLDAPTPIAPLSSLGLSNVGDGEIVLQCDAPVFVICGDGELHLRDE